MPKIKVPSSERSEKLRSSEEPLGRRQIAPPKYSRRGLLNPVSQRLAKLSKLRRIRAHNGLSSFKSFIEAFGGSDDEVSADSSLHLCLALTPSISLQDVAFQGFHSSEVLREYRSMIEKGIHHHKERSVKRIVRLKGAGM